jgi:two-component system OmpR family sensor kinase
VRVRWPGGIRGRLLGGFVLLFVLGLGASSVFTAFLVDDYIFDRAGDKLVEDARNIAALTRTGPQTVRSEQFETLLGPPLGIIGLDRDRAVLFSTGEGEGPTAALVRITAPVAPLRLVDADGDLGRDTGEKIHGDLAAVRVLTPGLRVVLSNPVSTVEVAELVLVSDANVDDGAIVDFFEAMTQVAVAALIVLIALAVLVLRIGLRPLTRMAQAAEAIAEGSRDERLPISDRHTETDVLAAAVNRAFDAQARAEARARTFAADASHELRTPIATVSGWLELYRQGGLKEDDLEPAVARIEDEVGRIRLLVEELGLLARLDTGRPLERAPLDLVRLTESVVEDAQVIHSGLDITLRAPATVAMTGDAARLQQVLRNLVGNAVQHTPEGTRVRLIIADVGGEVRVEVTDNGPGIPEADVSRVFERFWRAEASRSRDYGGSGLGLAIVQAIVRAHGGRVEVRSTVGGGTTVVLHLPAG